MTTPDVGPRLVPRLSLPQDREPSHPVARWLRGGGGGTSHAAPGEVSPTWPWYRVLWLTGVDYFSTLGYQPGIALLAVGAIAPLATGVLLLVTLFGALPIYREVAKRSYLGNGSISMLEKLLPGWKGKVFVLALIGFASTDFVITMTLSAADAAQHAVENPFLVHALHGMCTPITIVLLALLAAVFLSGFREAIGLATWLAVPYLALNSVVLARGAWEIVARPELVVAWRSLLTMHGDVSSLAVAAVLAFPALALGLSGFETGVTVMPLLQGDPTDPSDGPPPGRIRSTRRLLTAAALIMSFFLMASSIVTTLVIPEVEWRAGGEASGRALAWLAHHYLGSAFGTAYDASTVLILWFAGASAMAAMLNLIPRYLPRFGMAPAWISYSRPLILVLFAIDVVVTLVFDSDVEAQGGAYATGVLALICSAAVAVTLATWREARTERRFPVLGVTFALITLVFVYTLVDNIHTRPDGIVISSVFIAAILLLGAVSRYQRATEFRVERLAFADDASAALFEHIRSQKVNLVTIKHIAETFEHYRTRIRKHYNVGGAFCFVHVDLAEDRSLFDTSCTLKVGRIGDDYRITISNAVAVPNVIAYVSELVDPHGIFLGLTDENPMSQALRFLLWGEGETGVLVYHILLRYWGATPGADRRPNLYLMSEPKEEG